MNTTHSHPTNRLGPDARLRRDLESIRRLQVDRRQAVDRLTDVLGHPLLHTVYADLSQAVPGTWNPGCRPRRVA